MEVLLTKHEQKRARHRAQRRLSSKSLSSDVLIELLAVGVATYQGLRRWPFTTVSREQDRMWRELYREYVRQEEQTLKRLKKRRLIETRETQDGLAYILTERGRTEAMRQAILTTEGELPEGQWCYVSFDIPEIAREERRMWRGFLKKAGFEMVHQSLWRCRKDLAEMLQSLLLTSQTTSKNKGRRWNNARGERIGAIQVFVGNDSSQIMSGRTLSVTECG